MSPVVGQPYTKLYRDGTYVTGIVLCKWVSLEGRPMFILQRPDDFSTYMMEEGPITRPEKRFLDWSATKY